MYLLTRWTNSPAQRKDCVNWHFYTKHIPLFQYTCVAKSLNCTYFYVACILNFILICYILQEQSVFAHFITGSSPNCKSAMLNSSAVSSLRLFGKDVGLLYSC